MPDIQQDIRSPQTVRVSLLARMPLTAAAKLSALMAALLSMAFAVSACDDDADIGDGQQPILHLGVHLVEAGEFDAFIDAHDSYRQALAAQPGVGPSRIFQSFYSSTASDVPAERVGLTEITVFDSEAAYWNAVAAVGDTSAALQLRTIASLEADLLVRQPDGSVDLNDFAGAALEIAVRGVDPANRDNFHRAQDTFVAQLTQIEDTKTVEFIVVGDSDITAGYSTYATQSALDQTLDFYNTAAVAGDFFASFTLLSSQFGNYIERLEPIAP